MGNTCKPMAVSFQCMIKSTTNKKKEKKKTNKQTKKETGKGKEVGSPPWNLEKETALITVAPCN